eukprot:TCONS_00073770-protein
MMRKSFRLRTAKESVGLKDSHKHVHTRTAQRKFASNVHTPFENPVQPIDTESVPEVVDQTPPKTEDFINFLCTRDLSYLPKDLEIFANPSNAVIPDEEMDKFFKDETNLESVIEPHNATPPVNKFQPTLPPTTGDNETHSPATTKHQEKEPSLEPKLKKPYFIESKEKEPQNSFIMVEEIKPTSNEMSALFPFVGKLFEETESTHRSIVVIQPDQTWKCFSYVQENLKFEVEVYHVHRLKHPAGSNFTTLQCLRKCFEKNEKEPFKIPSVGLVEVDLPYLMEVVSNFGGVDSVNSDQSWKELAEQLHIPRSASRRAIQLEKIYMQYVLPYELLTDAEKSRIASAAKNEARKHDEKSNICSKKVSIETFHRMACNVATCYEIKDMSAETIENHFWKVVNSSNRHTATYAGTLDLLSDPQSYQNAKAKVFWKLSTVYNHELSALKYLGKVSQVSSPFLLTESVFSTSGFWEIDEYGFYILSYLHSGSDKIWYVIETPESKIEQTKLQKLIDENQIHNTFSMPNEILEKGFTVKRCVQKEGQFLILEPNCYYFTISTGYSLSEIINFAPMSWLEDFNGFEFDEDSFIETRMLLNYTNDILKSEKSTSFNKDFLKEKLDQLKKLILNLQQKCQKAGITRTKYTKNATRDAAHCFDCECNCYVLVISLPDKPDEFYCNIHGFKLKRSLRTNAVATFLISPTKLSQLINRIDALS